MNLFDQLVTEALENQPQFSTLRMVVEKELLHHDILRILSAHGFLKNLTFIGGTCLRYCYGGIRLSEDLDFTGGVNFTRNSLKDMSQILIENLYTKYGFVIRVSEPTKDKLNVDTWKIKIETRSAKKDLPAQRINIDICAITSYEIRPMLLINPYAVEMGTSGLIINAQSREEIYSDKIIAFALRLNRLKYRDLWDMVWLHQQAIKPQFKLVDSKLKERKIEPAEFLKLFSKRGSVLNNPHVFEEFKQEMQRFLPLQQMQVLNQAYWESIINLICSLKKEMENTSFSVK